MERALILICLGSASALRRQSPIEDLSRDRSPSARAAGATGFWRTLGNYTNVADMQLHDPIPELKDCQGFSCIEKYVKFDDGAFSWGMAGNPDIERDALGRTWTLYPVSLSSQAWLAQETGRDAWLHTMKLIVPDTYKASGPNSDLITLFVEEGDGPEQTWAAEQLALRTGALTAVLSQVPNAPLTVKSDGKYSMSEEPLKAWSWYKFAHHADRPEWPVEMPDVKSVVRAMDALEKVTLFASARAGIDQVKRFIVSGHSKRAMAAYMAGAVDQRVKAVVPLGITLDIYKGCLDVEHNLNGIPFGGIPYQMEGVMNLTPDQWKSLSTIIDPVNYIERLAMPKLAVFSGSDDFYPPDVTKNWWWKLPEPKMMYVYGDAGHRGIRSDDNADNHFLDVTEAFVSGFMSGSEMPKIDWKIDPKRGSILVKQVSAHTPTSVIQMASKTRGDKIRDFRKTAWKAHAFLEPLEGGDGRTWLATPPSADKWVAFYVSFEYAPPVKGASPWRVTTEVSVTPDTRPFPDANPNDPKRQEVVFPVP